MLKNLRITTNQKQQNHLGLNHYV